MGRIRCLAARAVNEVSLCVDLDDAWTYELVLSHQKAPRLTHLPVVVAEKVCHEGKTLLKRPDAEDREDRERLTQTALEQVNANRKFRAIASFFQSIVYRHILPQAVRDPKGFSPGPIFHDPFGRDIVLQIWNTPPKIRASRLNKLNEALRLAVPNLDDLTVEMDQSSGQPHFKLSTNIVGHMALIRMKRRFPTARCDFLAFCGRCWNREGLCCWKNLSCRCMRKLSKHFLPYFPIYARQE